MKRDPCPRTRLVLCAVLAVSCDTRDHSHAHNHHAKTGCDTWTHDLHRMHAEGVEFTERIRLAEQGAARMGDEALPCLKRAFDENEGHAAHDVMILVSKLAAGRTGNILSWLEDSSPRVRAGTLYALSYLKDPASLLPIVSRLEDSHASVRKASAEVLFVFADQKDRTIPALERALDDVAPSVRGQVAATLGLLGSVRSVPLIAKRLRDPDEDVREYAAYALKNLGGRSAVSDLEKALSDASPKVRAAVVVTLGKLGHRGSAVKLKRMLDDPVEDVREKARAALIELKR